MVGILLLSLAGCEDSPDDSSQTNSSPYWLENYEGKPVSLDIPHFVTGYFFPEKVEVVYARNVGYFMFPCLPSDWRDFTSYRDETLNPASAERYRSLCRKNGDVAFKGVREVKKPLAWEYTYSAVEITSIDVTANRAWGELPAGASWASRCRLEASTPRTYIASGYTATYDWQKVSDSPGNRVLWKSPELSYVSKPLNECTAEDFRMVWAPCNFSPVVYLPEPPEDIESYTLTVTINLADGTVLKCPVTQTYLDGLDDF